MDYAEYQEDVEQHDGYAARKAPFLAYGAEDEVGALLWNEAEGGLGAVEIALAEEASGAYGNLGLMHVVAPAGRVLGHSEQDFDALALVLLQHVVEDQVHAEGGDHAGRYHSRAGHAEGIPAKEAEDKVAYYLDGHQRQQEIERLGPEDYPHNHQGDERDVDGEPEPLAAPEEIVGEAGDDENGQQGRDYAEAQGDYEEGYDAAQQGQPPAGYAFAVEHEDEADIDEHRAGFVLGDYGRHRQQEDGAGYHIVPEAAEMEVHLADHVGEHQGTGYFGELGGLYLDRAYLYPGVGALGVVGDEDHQHQEEEHQHVGGQGGVLVDARGNGEEYDRGHQHGRAYPHQLLAGAAAPHEHFRVLVVHGGVDVQEADENQYKPAACQPPVHGSAHSSLTCSPFYHFLILTLSIRLPSSIRFSRYFLSSDISPLR